MGREPQTHNLPDGSICTVEPSGITAYIVSRYVDGECVWGQVFWPDAAMQCVDRMHARPEDYVRWYNR